jgi:hypothetical protein
MPTGNGLPIPAWGPGGAMVFGGIGAGLLPVQVSFDDRGGQTLIIVST